MSRKKIMDEKVKKIINLLISQNKKLKEENSELKSNLDTKVEKDEYDELLKQLENSEKEKEEVKKDLDSILDDKNGSGEKDVISALEDLINSKE